MVFVGFGCDLSLLPHSPPETQSYGTPVCKPQRGQRNAEKLAALPAKTASPFPLDFRGFHALWESVPKTHQE